MNFIEQIKRFTPEGIQEEVEKQQILEYIARFPDTILTRNNPFMHLTSSGFVLTPKLDKALLIHHTIYKTWAWTGGHADGEPDLLAAAIREAKEETGIEKVEVLEKGIASLDILTVQSHFKRGSYIAPHLHLSAAYLLIAPEEEKKHFRKKEDENTGVQWIAVEELAEYSKEEHILPIYKKLLRRAQQIKDRRV